MRRYKIDTLLVLALFAALSLAACKEPQSARVKLPSTDKVSAPVSVTYEITAPDADGAQELTIEITAGMDAGGLAIEASAEPGVSMLAGERAKVIGPLGAGRSASESYTVSAGAGGAGYVNFIVSGSFGAQQMMRAFSVPVGDPKALAARKSSSDEGEPGVVIMPATEPGR